MPVSSQYFGSETFTASKGHVRESHGDTLHEAGLGIQMDDGFVVTNIAADGQSHGKVHVGDKLVGVDGMTLAEANVTSVDDFKQYMIQHNGEAALHFNLMPTNPPPPPAPPAPKPEKKCSPLIPALATVAVACLVCGAALPWLETDVNASQFGLSHKSETGLYRRCQEMEVFPTSQKACARIEVKDMSKKHAFSAVVIPLATGLFLCCVLLHVSGKLKSKSKALGWFSLLLGALALAGAAVFFHDVQKAVDNAGNMAKFAAGGPLALVGAVGVILTGAVMLMKSGTDTASSASTVSLSDVESQLDVVKK